MEKEDGIYVCPHGIREISEAWGKHAWLPITISPTGAAASAVLTPENIEEILHVIRYTSRRAVVLLKARKCVLKIHSN